MRFACASGGTDGHEKGGAEEKNTLPSLVAPCGFSNDLASERRCSVDLVLKFT